MPYSVQQHTLAVKTLSLGGGVTFTINMQRGPNNIASGTGFPFNVGPGFSINYYIGYTCSTAASNDVLKITYPSQLTLSCSTSDVFLSSDVIY